MSELLDNTAEGGDELSGELRRAVDAVRSKPSPEGSRDRAVDRATGLKALHDWRGRRSGRFLALAAMAAALLIGVTIWLSHPWDRAPEVSQEFALRSAEPDRDLSGTDVGLIPGQAKEGLGRDDAGDTKPDSSTGPDGRLRKAGDERDRRSQNGASAADVPGPKPQATAETLRELGAEIISGSPPGKGGFGGGFGGGQGAPGGGQAAGGFGRPNDPAKPGGGFRPERPSAPAPAPLAPPADRLERQGEGREPGQPADDKTPAENKQKANLRLQGDGGKEDPESRSRANVPNVTGSTRSLGEGAPNKKAQDSKDSSFELDITRIESVSLPSQDKDGKTEGKDDKGKEVGDGKAREKKAEDRNKDQVWRRKGGRPSFARVYVGDQTSLELVSLQVNVTVEGPRARTVVDHIFKNPHARQLEGTFEYPLPAGASPSYFAMFLGQTRDSVPQRFNAKGDLVNAPATSLFFAQAPTQLVKKVDVQEWGRLQEARVVSKQKALETYEEIVRGRIDPALLEYAGGNTFTGRVFPIPPKGYNRVILAYEETLPAAGDRNVYRFSLPDCKLSDVDFHLTASPLDCLDARCEPKELARQSSESRVSFTKTWKDEGPGGDVVFSFRPSNPLAQAISGRQNENGPLNLYARVRPDLKVEKGAAFAHHAIFLLDTSLSEHPDRFGLSMKLLKKVLESDPEIQQFNVLTFNVSAAWVDPKGWIANTPAGREQVFAKLDGLVLEGATDFGAALARLAQPGFDVAARTPVNVFVLSDGQVTWGEPEVGPLVSRFESRCPFPTQFNCYRTGLGADNLELFSALTRRGGGVFNCFHEADLAAAAVAHRNQCVQLDGVRFVGGPEATDVLVAGRQAAIYPGGELIVAARMAKAGPTNLLLHGTFCGKEWAQEIPIEVTGYSELAPRGWGEVAVASLLSLNDSKLDGLVTAYCQQYGIGSRVASFLVLENDTDYKRFNLEEERGRTHAGDLGTFLDEAWRGLGRVVSSKEAFGQFLARIEPRVNLLGGVEGPHVKKLLGLLQDADYELPEAKLEGKLLTRKDVPAEYLARRDANVQDATTYLTEARRRADTGDAAGAVSALSSLVELYPARGDALRLVGYRLLDLRQAAQAVSLFRRVQEQRPFEPHSYRDLARSLEESGRYGLAALQYEIVLAGNWHNRFHQSLKLVALEEYGRMMRDAIAKKAVGPDLANHFGERLEKLDPKQFQSDLRVTMSWNTDNTDVDLWVIEPDGTKCFYQNRQTPRGGELTEDMTQGYGPERYQAKQAQPGVYRVVVHYFRPNPNLMAGETHVNVVVTRNAGTPQEKVERHTVILKRHNEEVEVCQIKF